MVNSGPLPQTHEADKHDPGGCSRCGRTLVGEDKHDTETCCSIHEQVLCHRCYRRSHFVEVCGCNRSFCEAAVKRIGEALLYGK